jgi:DNA-directed RNA polymerase specialized sigma24 family protein
VAAPPGTYPLLSAYGPGPIRFLTTEEAAAATPEERIRSVWPMLVSKAVRFSDGLSPRERALLDAEDLLVEIWIKLRERDHLWVPARGTYLNFAAKIVERECLRLLDRAGPVRRPGNSAGRLKGYDAESAAGRLSARRDATRHRLRRALEEPAPLDPAAPADAAADGPPVAAALRREAIDLAADAALRAVADLPPEEADAVGRTFGLWGQPEQAPAAVAAARGVPLGRVRDAVRRARDRMRATLEALDHPAIPEDDR